MNSYKISTFSSMLCLLVVGFSDTAHGQITTAPSIASGMYFQVQSGGAAASQNLAINTPEPTTVFITVPANAPWMKINGNPSTVTFDVNTDSTVLVTVNTAGLTSGLTYQATIPMYISGAQSTTQVNFQVTLAVGTPSLLSPSPASLSFGAVVGTSSGSPSSIPITITSSGQALTYNVSAATTNGTGNWLLLSNTSNISTSSSSPGFSVYVNPSLAGAVGTYTGTVTVQSTTTGDSATIPVTLTITAGALLNVTPTALNNFVFQAGSGQASFLPETQNLMISTTSGSLNYQVVATNPTGPAATLNWLVLSSTGGLATTTPQSLSVSLSSYSALAALPVGLYTITLAISPTGGGGTTTNITATLVVSNNGILGVNNGNLTFSAPFGSATTQTQNVQLTSSNGSSIPYTVQTNQSWLSASPLSGTTAANSVLTVGVNASNLAVSTTPYTGTVTVFPTNGDQYSVVINVTFTVTSATSTIYAAPAQLLFSDETIAAGTLNTLQPQLVELTSSSILSFTVTTQTMTASNCPNANWLNATPSQNTTPATLTISVVPTGMTAGFCSGTVVVTYNNGSSENTTTTIPVVVDVAPTPLLTVTPSAAFGVVTATYGSTSIITSQISIGSTDGSALGYSAFASTPNAPLTWLSLGNSEGTTQQYLQVQIFPNGLPVGVYTGSITISANNSANLPSGALMIPVVLTISANTTVSVSPTSLSFTQNQGATTAPASQTITLTATAGTTGGTTGFTATVSPVTGGSWLQVTPASGTATGTITASVALNTLSKGTYTSNIIVTFLNSASPTVTIPVSLVVTAAQSVNVAPTSLTFNYQLGSTAIATQTLNVTSTNGAVAVTVGTTSTTGWLSVSPTSGSTGASGAALALTVSIAPASLTTAQTYSGTITITPAGQTAISVPVTVVVTGVVAPQPSSISNSASGAFGVIAPGELITIKGTNLGPTTATSFSVAAGGTVSSTLAGVQVMFDTVPGTPIYVSPTQINVIVPYDIAGRASTNVTVLYSGQTSAAISQSVANQAPGIFTDSSNGAGQASVLNQNGTLNGPSSGIVIGTTNVSTTPAAEGSIIAVYMTGGGQTSPASADGTVTPTNTLYNLPGTVTATINGVPATVKFAGAAPGLVTGVIQVNLLVPTGISGSALPLAITINGSTSLSGPTVAVQ
jgi:uncharacterized protein (TIGR03437 family)